MTCPRFTVRRLMVAIAVVAIIISAVRLELRRAKYLRLVKGFTGSERQWILLAEGSEAEAKRRVVPAGQEVDPFNGEISENNRRKCLAYAASLRRMAAWDAERMRRYAREASHPWESEPVLAPLPEIEPMLWNSD